MSDIKNENDNLKDFPNYNKNKFDQVFPGIRERDEKIASLITTIESLQREIASHGPEGRNYTNQQYVDLLLKFESQKEEIEALRRSLTGESIKNANIQKELVVYKKSYDALLLQLQEGEK